MRITKHRQKIINLLCSKQIPLNAETIITLLPVGLMDLSTVYRSLEILYENNYIGKSIIDNTAHYFYNQESHHHYMICKKCFKKILLDCCIHSLIDTIEKQHNFMILNHDLTLYGHCQDCQ